MTAERAREEFPLWADQELPKLPKRMAREREVNRLVKRYAPTVAASMIWLITILSACAITGSIVKHNTTLIVREECAAQYDAELEAYKEQEAAARFVSGDASKAMQMKNEADQIAKVLYGCKSNSGNDLRTLAWCVLNRVDSKAYPNSVEEVVAQKSQWMAYSEKNPVLDELWQIAYEVVETWHDGHRPVDPEYVYMDWTPSKITLRNTWDYSSKTKTWSYS